LVTLDAVGGLKCGCWPLRVVLVLMVLAVFVSILLLKVRLRLLLKTVGCILLAT
jgi:hypothetical protein